MRSKPVFAAALAILLSNFAAAQGVDPGLHWSGSSGTSAGAICGGFTCTPVAIPVSVNEVVTISVRGTFGTAWAIGLSSAAGQCTPIPGIQGALILSPPITIALSGVFTQGDPALSCPGGLETITFTFPALPPWTPIAIQAVGQRPDLTFSLTSAITVWVL
jgi:hypothetical protein